MEINNILCNVNIRIKSEILEPEVVMQRRFLISENMYPEGSQRRKRMSYVTHSSPSVAWVDHCNGRFRFPHGSDQLA